MAGPLQSWPGHREPQPGRAAGPGQQSPHTPETQLLRTVRQSYSPTRRLQQGARAPGAHNALHTAGTTLPVKIRCSGKVTYVKCA